MRRLCIFVLYDMDNIVDDYIGYMLQELRKIADFLVAVCNYRYITRGVENVQSKVDKIYFRENIGFDAGAYKDTLCQYLGWDEVRGFDELLLLNDSFYGPFYSLEDLFLGMEKVDADYWGLTRSPRGKFDNGQTYESHIQSYFLVLRKSVLSSNGFRLFWEKMKIPLSLAQAVVAFELGINKFLQDFHFAGTTVMEISSFKFDVQENENPYIVCPLELIREAGIPILKRKSLGLRNVKFDNVIEALKFIERECHYDIDLITKHLSRIGKRNNIMALDVFYASHKKIYIYGAGGYGKNLAKYFVYKGWKFEKFIVTNAENASEFCVAFEQADIAEQDGIIIAVGSEEAFSSILGLVEKRCNRNQIFNPDEIIW